MSIAGFRMVRVRPRRAEVGTTQPDGAVPITSLQDAYYRSAAWRYTVPVDRLVCRPCFSYSADGWHPFVAAIREHIEQPSTRYNESILRLFFDRFQPRSVAEAKLIRLQGDCRFLDEISAQTLFEPWVLREPPFDDPSDPACRPPGSALFGPVSFEAGERAYKRLILSYRSVRRYGYRPDLFPGGRIGIVVLRHQGEERYLVVHGQHRAAALAALGHQSVEVGVHPGVPPVVDSTDVQRWPHVALEHLSADCAIRVFRRYFEDAGSECARMIGVGQDA